jgi:hypothetical protein
MNGDAALRFICERSDSVLVIIECGHCDILLEPFNMIHKGNFARSPAFTEWRHNVNEFRLMRQCSIRHVFVIPGRASARTRNDSEPWIASLALAMTVPEERALARVSKDEAAAPDMNYALIAEARSATAFITASRMPGS